MMGDGSHSGLAASDAHSPFLQPSLRDEVGPGPERDSESQVYTMFAQCLHKVFIVNENVYTGL